MKNSQKNDASLREAVSQIREYFCKVSTMSLTERKQLKEELSKRLLVFSAKPKELPVESDNCN